MGAKYSSSLILTKTLSLEFRLSRDPRIAPSASSIARRVLQGESPFSHPRWALVRVIRYIVQVMRGLAPPSQATTAALRWHGGSAASERVHQNTAFLLFELRVRWGGWIFNQTPQRKATEETWCMYGGLPHAAGDQS